MRDSWQNLHSGGGRNSTSWLLDPNDIHLPGIYVDRLVKGKSYEKRIEKTTLDRKDEALGLT